MNSSFVRVTVLAKDRSFVRMNVSNINLFGAKEKMSDWLFIASNGVWLIYSDFSIYNNEGESSKVSFQISFIDIHIICNISSGVEQLAAGGILTK